MSDEMTIRQHNEALVLEKAQLAANYETTISLMARLIAGLMGRPKTRKLTPAQWAATEGVTINFRADDDGGVVVIRGQEEATDET